MRAVILCIFALFIGSVSKAQSTTVSLNITLTDVQSVTFGTVVLDELTPEGSKNGTLQVLSHSTSQIRKINSKDSEYERLYKQFYSGKTAFTSASSDKDIYGMAVNSTLPPKSPENYNKNLVIYQIDPR